MPIITAIVSFLVCFFIGAFLTIGAFLLMPVKWFRKLAPLGDKLFG